MGILEQREITLAEVKDLTKDLEDKKQITDYLKRFGKLTKEKVSAITEEIKALNNIKVKDSDIVKICDFLPEDAEDLNKIFIEVSLDEGEVNAILEIIKKHK